ncbi:metallopeptidase family protein [Galactobacter sp.]|uniref:metallopeptidase family protein n=1 Tax=Galactobacter sp. TaxID=2676125 RepID=UPI0025BE0813|nr:metallopeptidase family protein [Galactobacter sp.]
MSARFDLQPEAARPGLRRAGHGRRRDRRGRAGRGSLLPPDAPAALSRDELFEDMVSASVERLQAHVGDEISHLEFFVSMAPDADMLLEEKLGPGEFPLGSVTRPNRRHKARLEIFRKPVESLAGSREALPWTVFDVVVELVADYVSMPPEQIHPDYRGHHRRDD